MNAYTWKRFAVQPAMLLLAVLVLMTGPAGAQILDRDGDGVSDIWTVSFGVEGYGPDEDTDGDGIPNRVEALAGTDPVDANSVARIAGWRMTPGGFEVNLIGALGKRFELQSSESVDANAVWAPEADTIPRNHPSIVMTAPADRVAKFFRVAVIDVDSDNDGLNDWEEYQLGLDPLSATSNGQSNNQGVRLNDRQFVLGRLASQSLASLMAARMQAAQVQPSEPVCGVVAASGNFPIAAASVPAGTGLTGQYYTNASSTYTNVVNFNATNLFLTTNDAIIDLTWGPALSPNLSNGNYTVRWTGQVEPQYSETYYFEARTDDGVKLWVNDQLIIDRWQTGSATWTGTITLQADVRYNLRMEYYNRGGSARARLSWYSASQPRQVIPSIRLYPSSGGYAPGAVVSPLTAVAFVGQPFSYTIIGANTTLSYEATNVPAGLVFNSTNGVISGVPSLAGSYDVYVAVSNWIGTASATLRLEVLDTGSSVTREVWLGVAGSSVTNIPVHLPAAQTNSLGNLEGVTNFADNYGERIRGYLVPPVTGNYYFWIAGNAAAELWISNDSEPANKVRRAFVTKPTLARQWTLDPKQRSGWLSLQAGRRYYIEILHKAGVTTADHWSVAWLQDPTGTNTVPAGVVPGYVLAPYVETPAEEVPGTLYSANMVAQSGAVSSGVGSATLRLSADESQAVLRYSHSALSAPVTAKHIHADTYLGKNPQGQIVFDIDTATPELDGSYVWQIGPSGALTAADIVEIIKQGKAYINVHSANYPAGEINGHFSLAAGTSKFSPPPAPPAWVPDHSSSNAAARFLNQATFGASPAEIKAVRALGYPAWIEKQFKQKIGGHLTNVFASANPDPNDTYPATLTFNTWWKQSITAPDQLRQRVAFALSQILVVSEAGPLEGNSRALSAYYDTLLKHSFGNFRDLLEEVTLSPAMGIYLDMRRNDKGNLVSGTHPNENYAREILQLFSVGLNRMWPDGTLVLNSNGDLVPTYDQDVIIGFAHVFTGWNYWQTNQANKRLPVNWNPSANYTNPMVLVPTHHEMGTKRLLDNVVLPAAYGSQADSGSTNFDHYCSQDLELALDSIFYNESVGPFICRQLIQRLVTSHPSRDYVYRVVQRFNDNGAGVRGDMKAVIRAILLDYEARGTNVIALPTHGKQREPLLRATALARAFPAPVPLKGSYKQTASQSIVVTTAKPHRLNNNDDVFLSFSTKSGPASQIYNNVSVIDARSFAVNVAGASFGTYGQSGNTITVTNTGHGLAVGMQIFLTFTSGGAANAIYTVATVPSSSIFTVTAAASAMRAGGCAFARWTGVGYIQSGTNITFITDAPHGLAVGRLVSIDFLGNGSATNGVYRVAAIVSPTRFTIYSSTSDSRTESDTILYPLIAAPVVRSGSVTIRYSTWNMGYTDSGFSSSLSQTPLNSPTVFNFYFPDFKFPGILASAGLTTPEFQLTSDSSVTMQMNFLTGAVLGNTGNTNGLSSFTGGNGSIAIDLGPWMTVANTADAGIPGLVESLNTVLCSGQLSAAAKSIIVNYVASTARFPLASPTPTNAQMRDRVRAVVHLMVSSPEFIVQR